MHERFQLSFFFMLALICSSEALAQDLPKPLSDPATRRELFLAAAIVIMMLWGLISFLLLGRISERTHVALAMLSVLSGSFGLLVLFGGYMYGNPVAAALILLLLFGLFKLMSQFETKGKVHRKPE